MHFNVRLPILGFPQCTGFDLQTIDTLFSRLINDTEEKLPAFLLIDPFVVNPEFAIELPVVVEEALEIQSADEVRILAIMITAEPIERSLVNFRAPLIFNTRTQTMGQMLQDGNAALAFGIAEPLEKFFKVQNV